jgi:hypothetical protein
MGNCSTAQRSGDLRLVTASVQVLELSSADPKAPEPASWSSSTTTTSTQQQTTCLFRKKFFASSPASIHAPPPSPWLKKVASFSTSTELCETKPDATSSSSSTSSSTTATSSTTHPSQQTTTTTTEIVLASPLPHSRFCKRLRMRRTPDWERVVLPLVTPGARLKVMYDPATLMIHVLERDDSAGGTPVR